MRPEDVKATMQLLGEAGLVNVAGLKMSTGQNELVLQPSREYAGKWGVSQQVIAVHLPGVLMLGRSTSRTRDTVTGLLGPASPGTPVPAPNGTVARVSDILERLARR